jgi:hypothetical protein
MISHGILANTPWVDAFNLKEAWKGYVGEKMRIQILKCSCDYCGNKCERPFLPDGAYGEFLLFSKSGAVAYLNVFDDSSYDEVCSIVKSIPLVAHSSASATVDLIQRIYGKVACDPDVNNDFFQIDNALSCYACGCANSLSCSLENPKEAVGVKIPSVTHSKWSNLSDMQKLSVVASEILTIRS